MDETLELCRRVLGATPLADQAAAQARLEGRHGRVTRLAAAVKACRALDGEGAAEQPPADPGDARSQPLAVSVAHELSIAAARLPEREREALALRELLGLSHEEIAQVMTIGPAAVPPLLARARLQLHAQRRGTRAEPGAECADREQALRLLACRQDSAPLPAGDQQWLLEHMAHCEGCEQAHAAMLEASVCYRAWRPEECTDTDGPAPAAPDADPDR